jgi:Zn-dependent protease
MFRAPPSSSYDLNFTLLGFPVRVSPWFWLIAILFGLGSGSVLGIAIWVVVVFVSILIHEMGHGLAFRRFGWDSELILYSFGGLAAPVGSRQSKSGSLTPVEQIIISLAGPAAGFLLAGLVVSLVIAAGGIVRVSWLLFVIPFPSAFVPGWGIVNEIVGTMLWVNIFWGLINLLPVLPLDGGRVSQSLFIIADPWDGPRKALWLSIIVGAVVAVASYVFLNSIYMAFLFGILALQSYALLQGRGGIGL